MTRLKLVEILTVANGTTVAVKQEMTAEALDAFMLAPETTVSQYAVASPTNLRFGSQTGQNGVIVSIRELN